MEDVDPNNGLSPVEINLQATPPYEFWNFIYGEVFVGVFGPQCKLSVSGPKTSRVPYGKWDFQANMKVLQFHCCRARNAIFGQKPFSMKVLGPCFTMLVHALRCLVVYDIPDNLYEFFFHPFRRGRTTSVSSCYMYIYIHTNTHIRMGLAILWAENLIFSH